MTGSSAKLCGESVDCSGCQAVLTSILLYKPSIKQTMGERDYTHADIQNDEDTRCKSMC